MHRRLGLLAILALATAALGGCVTRGTHDEVVRERDRLSGENRALRERVRALEDSAASLADERVELIDTLEDLRQERQELDEQVRVLRRTRGELAANLAAREAEVAELEQLEDTHRKLIRDLEADLAAGEIRIEQLREGLIMNLPGGLLFPSGAVDVSVAGRQMLGRLAAELRSSDHRIEVRGHTDDVAIRPSARFQSNWDLAAARAARVVQVLEDAGIDPARMSAASFGPHHPVADNSTAEGRAQNRRIEIRLIPVRRAPSSPPPGDS